MTRPCDMLPPVRGSIARDVGLKDMVWFRAGGPADVLFRPADVEDLGMFLAARSRDIPVTVIGVGSNLLVRDGGMPGTVVRRLTPCQRAKAPTISTPTRLRYMTISVASYIDDASFTQTPMAANSKLASTMSSGADTVSQ